MTPQDTAFAIDTGQARVVPNVYRDNPQLDANSVSWDAIVAGAAAAAALSLILLMLGTGLGLSAISPWTYDGVSAATFGYSTIIWLTFTQIVASGFGGYLAGRLRKKWARVTSDETYFRDTAHGFLAWAVASLTTAVLLTSVIGSIVSNGVQAGASVAAGVATAATTAAGSEKNKFDVNKDSMGYFVDSLFRTGEKTPTPDENSGTSPDTTASQSPSTEIMGIFLNALRTESLPDNDVRHIGQVVAKRAGLTQAEAEQRVRETYSNMQTKLRNTEAAAKEAADKARKTTAYAALWLFVSLLIGAFTASLAAVYGGRHLREV